VEDCFVLLAAAAEAVPDRVTLAQRAKLFGALFLLTLTCIAVVLLAWLALRVGRRSVRRQDLKYEKLRSRARVDDWASKPLIPPEDVRHDADED